MKRKTTSKSRKASVPAVPKEAPFMVAAAPADPGPMVRTQIYLNRSEYDFLRAEAARWDKPMAAVIRLCVDEKMRVPEDAWTNNPMLEPTPHDPDFESPEDAAINHDHYLYGCPKKFVKVKGKWVPAPPLPDEYHSRRGGERDRSAGGPKPPTDARS